MKMKSRIVSLTTAALLSLTLAGQGFAAGTPFKDVADTGAKDKILSLQEKGYVSGVADGLFAPGRPITGAESIQLFVNAFGLNLDTVRFIKAPKATDYFKKANDSAWYAEALIIAAVKGMELPGELEPNKEWTREEFTYQLVRAMEKYGNLPMINLIPAKIADEDQITIEYSGAVQRALKYGVVKLDGEGKLNPKGKILRWEAAEEVYNALEYIKAHPAAK